ncbi:hypothetical protein [Jeotgalibacillus campisalis]|uniref:Spore coat protein n=1 Tax=Jeotgalibacillus campisalis TaxID=220754 RepID=A0A0C2VI84_9BACL|nr:hypothetical protein [Jeotgalibacillus campisalis]KIL43723.1 hypothetical protein KR50_32430 [Jeotgalibacillus campisalis]
MQNQSLSTKDALYIEDILAWNLLAAKKTHYAASQCQTPQVKAELEAACQLHSKHFEAITNFLSSNTQATGQMQ